MKLLETFKTAITSLLKNKARSFLTMLGVIIGTFAVSALVATVQGFQNYITDQFNSLGSNLILIVPGSEDSGGDPSAAYTDNKLDLKHVELIDLELGDEIIAVTPSLRVGKSVKYKSNTYYATVVGGTEETDKIFSLTMSSGRFYTANEHKSASKVAVLGFQAQEELFGNRNPVGESIVVDGVSFEVIGTVDEKGVNFDDRVYIPDTTVDKALGISSFSSIALKSTSGDVDDMVKKVKLVLLSDLKKDDFSVFTQQDLLESINNILGILSTGLAAIAGISLLVGGIGIMNIMLVSVTERTREIGLRKALGATSKNIATQFMIESVLLSVLGGILGLALAYLGTILVQPYFRAEIPWWTVLLAFGFSSFVGVAFGTYPAISAAKKDPIEALRFE